MSFSIRRVVSPLVAVSLLAGCSGDDSEGGTPIDSGAADSGAFDSASPGVDAAKLDTGADQAVVDTGASSNDAASVDDGSAGDGAIDAAPPADAAPGDAAGDADATVSDAAADTGPVDAGPVDTGADVYDGGASASGLVLRYLFDEASGTVVSDTSGKGHNGQIESTDAGASTGRTATGRAAGGLALAGTHDVTLPSGVLTGVSSATLGAWVKLNTVAAWSRVFDFGNGPVGTGNRWTFLTPSAPGGAANGGVQWNVYGGVPADGGTREAVVTPGTALPTGVWKHIAVTTSGSSYQMYIDGFPVAELANGPVIPLSEMEPLAPASWLGKSRFADPALDGTLDDVEVYNRVLTATEVANLAWPQHDYSYYRFDEGAGTAAADSSDNAIAATLSGGATWSANGRLGSAYDAAGGAAGATGPHASLAANPLQNCTTAFTVASWVKVHAASNWSRIFDFGAGTGTFVYLAPTDGAGLHFAMGKTGVPAFDLVASAPLPSDNAWHHAAVTLAANGDVVLYVDGASVKAGNSAALHASDFATALPDSWFGKSRFPDPYLNGSLDDIRIACRAYTADEIKNLAHGP